MSGTAPFRVAIVGSGPAGCYLAQSLLRAVPESEIVVFDRLATPFGLVRYGVAADHQHTKAITRQFDRVFTDERVRFAGNVELGRDVTLDALRAGFDAVVLATGLSKDRALDIPGDHLPGVYGSGSLTRVLNSHPGERPVLPQLGSDVVLVGGGNVAVDLLRFLVKDRADYRMSDIADHALDAYLANPAKRVTVLIRSNPAQLKSDAQMVKELAALPRARYASPEASYVDDALDADRTTQARLAALRELVSPDRPASPGPEVTLHFRSVPLRVLGSEKVEGVEFQTDEGVTQVSATALLTAIGFTHTDDALAEFSSHPAESGRVGDRLYRTGWAKRGPRGAIPENRSCAKQVADEIVADLASGALQAGSHPGYAALDAAVRERAICFEEWSRINMHEQRLATAERARRKLVDHEEMIEIARTGHGQERNIPS